MRDATTRKRAVNQEMLEGTINSEEPVAFFCECGQEDCYRAVWLTCWEYERYLDHPDRHALSAEHHTTGAIGEGSPRVLVAA